MSEDMVVAAVVDRCVALRAEIADKEQELAKLEAELEATGVHRAKGSFATVTITRNVQRTLIDWQAVAERFNPGKRLIATHTSKTKPYTLYTYTA